MDSETTAEEIDSMNKTLVSKISIISTYATKALETLEDTILGLDTQEEDSGATGLYEVDHSGANIEFTTEAEKIKELQKTEYRFAGKNPNNYISFGETEPKDVYEIQLCQGDFCVWGSEMMGLPTFGTNEECDETYNQMQEMFQESGMTGSCNQKTKAGDKIYWRVIGLVNTPEGQRVKIIRDSSIGEYSWDISPEGINRGWGVNEWSQSDLMKLLNPNFDNNQENICDSYGDCQQKVVNNSLYWNGTSGNCYVMNYEQTTTCDFSSIGMPKELKKMIEEVTWNTGANADETFKTTESEYYYDIPTTKMYEYERSKNNGKQLCESKDCNDEEKRTSTWRGKVGLMYPSDYGYATSGGSEDSRSKCLSQSLYFWTNMYTDSFPEEIDHPNCYENNWLGGWTMTPAGYDEGAYLVFVVNAGVFIRPTVSPGDVRPSVFLQSDVMVVDGNGSKDSPWILGID